MYGVVWMTPPHRLATSVANANYRCQRKGHNDGQVIERAGHLLNPFESENLQPSGWQQGRFWIEIHGMDMGKEMSIQPRVAGLHQIKQQASNEQGPQSARNLERQLDASHQRREDDGKRCEADHRRV